MSEKVFIIFPKEGESATSLIERVKKKKGKVFLILFEGEEDLLRHTQKRDKIFRDLADENDRITLAVKSQTLVLIARSLGFTVLDRPSLLKKALKGQPELDEVLRLHSPHLFRQALRSKLQAMGLLSLPRIRIFLLILLSVLLFFFVFFRLLPSAEINVWPRHDTISQTANVFLVQSGATLEIPDRVRTMELVPIQVTVNRSITFDEVSKEFTGTPSRVAMTIINDSDEGFELMGRTQFVNQSGVRFRLLDPAKIPPRDELTVRAEAENLDLYGQVIGKRGNVPAGLKWEIPRLTEDERKLVYGINQEPGFGGETDFRSVLSQKDIYIAEDRIKIELLSLAKQLVEEEKVIRNAQSKGKNFELLYYEELTQKSYSGITLPTSFVGEEVRTVPIEGYMTYTAYSYDAASLLDRLHEELLSHVRDGKRLLSDSITYDRLVVHVIDYSDNFSWIKLTVDLSGTEAHILDPLSAGGAAFGKKVRELTSGLKKVEALRILRNMPEVEKVEISMWPPWAGTLPTIPAHIYIEQQL